MAVTGAGTLANPYILSVPADLDFIRTKLTSHFRLGADIDMSAYGNFAPIGAISPTGQRFAGTLDGNGYKIKGLKIRGTTIYTGLFSVMSPIAKVKNLAVVDVDISSTNAVVGIIVGAGLSTHSIENCYTSGKVSGTDRVGGIGGLLEGVVKNCYSNADVSATVDKAFGIGVLGGAIDAGIHYCHFYGTVSATGGGGAITSVAALTLNRLSNSFYDSEVFGSISEVGTPLTTAQMKDPANFSAFDKAIWTLETGKYPYLTMIGEPVLPARTVTVMATSSMQPIEILTETLRKQVVVRTETVVSYSNPITSNATTIEDIFIPTFIIKTPQELDNMRNNLKANYELGSNIYMPDSVFPSVGTDLEPFKGNFDGKGFKIVNMLADVGLFRATNGSTLKNVGFENIHINSEENLVGGLVVKATNTKVSNVYGTGAIYSRSVAGGLVGSLLIGSTIDNCYSLYTKVSGTNTAGGIAGLTAVGTTIKYCYSNTPLYANHFNYGAITPSSNATLTRCYYDSDTTSNSSRATGRTTLQMKRQVTYLDYDPTIWLFREGEYPTLQVFGTPSKKLTVNASSYVEAITSHLERSRRKVAMTLTYTKPVSQSLHKELVTSCVSTIDDIVSSVKTHEGANVSTVLADSHIEQIYSDSRAIRRVTKVVSSGMSQFDITTEVIISGDLNKPVYAMVYIVESSVEMSITNNKTNMYHIENKTEQKVI